jgi:hypothetical protein
MQGAAQVAFIDGAQLIYWKVWRSPGRAEPKSGANDSKIQ